MLTGSPIASLAPGASDNTSYSASYTVTQSDIDAGTSISNVATATGDSPSGTDDVTDNSDDPTDPTNDDPDNDGDPEDPTDVEVTASAPNLSLEKTGVYNAVTGVITYSFTVTNTGNVT